MEWKWNKSSLIILLVGIIVLDALVFFNFYHRRKVLNAYDQSRITIRQASRAQNELSFKVTKLFLSYEIAISDYIKTPNQQTINKMVMLGTNLDDTLNQASDMFGLNVKRWVDLFRVWQYYAEQKLQQAPDSEKKKIWEDRSMSDTFSIYQIQISKQIAISTQDYDNASREVLLYGDYGLPKADAKTQSRLNDIFSQQASALLPQAVQNLKEHREGGTSCMGAMGDLEKPENMAVMVAYIQYQSRYCAAFVQSKTNSYCNKVRRLPPIDIDEKMKMLNETLAVCQIAEKRLQDEKEASQQKYGNLPYNEYFSKYVLPLVPKYTAILEAHAKSQGASIVYDACDPSSLPVVDFRDPEIDAQIAAYAIHGATACPAYFTR